MTTRHDAKKGLRHRIGLAVVLVAMIAPTAAAADQPLSFTEQTDETRADDPTLRASDEASVQRQLAKVARATVKFHRIPRAQAAGYDLMPPLHGCIQNPGVGAMGYHYFNQELIADLSVDPLRPEAMVYEPLANGTLRLAAVEWVVPAAAWHAAGNTEPPTVLGYDMHILNPAVGWYIFHAWIWKRNPAGIFEDWNPDVICP